ALNHPLRLSDLLARRRIVEPIEDARGPQIVVLKDDLIRLVIDPDRRIRRKGIRERTEIQSARDLILRVQRLAPLLRGHQKRKTTRWNKGGKQVLRLCGLGEASIASGGRRLVPGACLCGRTLRGELPYG